MSKLKKALAKASESRGLDNQKVIRGGIKPGKPVNLNWDEIVKQKPTLDISYSKTKVQKVENNILKRGKSFLIFTTPIKSIR